MTANHDLLRRLGVSDAGLDQLVLSAYGENLTGEAGYWATRGKSERYTIGYQTAPRMLGLGLTWRH